MARRKTRPVLIIGHAGSNQARIWVRGSPDHPVAYLEYEKEGGANEETAGPLRLEERHDFTGVFRLDDLAPSTGYRCRVLFAASADSPPAERRRPRSGSGAFVTAPPDDIDSELCFLLGSCNFHTLGIVSSPDPAFERIGRIIKAQQANFMIHCGDQIYSDIPLTAIPVFNLGIEQYRSKYVDAWGDSVPTSNVLRMIPHYMVLDDHEIVNNFANDIELFFGLIDVDRLKDVAVKAYREYQHLHNPQTYGHDVLYYHFSYGRNRFFVMDTRTERYQKTSPTQMISEDQLERFLAWMTEHPQDVKFVVSSVPFVADLKFHNDDKWCSPSFSPQRERIIRFIADNDIRNVIFLTGDMHNSYHASMKVSDGGQEKAIIHELMSSPINQLGKSPLSAYRSPAGPMRIEGSRISYTTAIEVDTFYRKHSNIMCIQVRDGSVHFELFRTKSDKPTGIAGSFPLEL